LPAHGVAYRGCNHEGYEGGGHHLPVGTRWTDIWGTVWQKELDGVMGFPQVHPLADLPHALATYDWPDPDDERICGKIYEDAQSWNADDTLLVGSHRETLWEKSYILVGMEALMCYLYTDRNAVRDLFHWVMDHQLAVARHYLAVGVEMVGMGDDLGTQRGPLLSPDLLQELFVPEYRRLFDLYNAHSVLISFHSCGHILPMVDMFADLGVDVLNPVQASANDLDELRRQTAGRMALQGGVSSATLVRGPQEAVSKEVRERVWQLGRDGGYICGPDQGMPWPKAHYQAMLDGIADYGVYPIDPPESD